MALTRETNLGTISVSNLLFAQIIADSFKLDVCKGKVWPATKKGRQIGTDLKFKLSDFASAIEVEENAEHDGIELTFSLIVKFGTSIRAVSEAIIDDVAEAIEQKHGKKPYRIKIRVAGVKSKQIAKRNLEVVKHYDIEG